MSQGIFKPQSLVTAEIAKTLLVSSRDVVRVTTIFSKNDIVSENDKEYFAEAKQLISAYGDELSNDLENNFDDKHKTTHRL